MEIIKQANLDDWELARRRAELLRLEQTIAEEEAALVGYQQALAAFERRYFEAFAATYAELAELEAQIAERAADLRPDDATKRRKAERLRARAEGTGAPLAPEETEAPRPKPDDALKAMYRALSKLIHPDLALDPAERQTRESLMAQANAAYAAQDAEGLMYLLNGRAMDQHGAIADGEETLARVTRQIELASKRLTRVTEARAAAEDNELARLMRRAEKARESGRDLFSKLAAELEEEKRLARKRLKALERRLGKAALKGGASSRG